MTVLWVLLAIVFSGFIPAVISSGPFAKMAPLGLLSFVLASLFIWMGSVRLNRMANHRTKFTAVFGGALGVIIGINLLILAHFLSQSDKAVEWLEAMAHDGPIPEVPAVTVGALALYITGWGTILVGITYAFLSRWLFNGPAKPIAVTLP